MMNLTVAFGAIIFSFPHLYRRLAATLLYEKPDEVEWNNQFTAGIRIIGALYVLLAVGTMRKQCVDN